MFALLFQLTKSTTISRQTYITNCNSSVNSTVSATAQGKYSRGGVKRFPRWTKIASYPHSPSTSPFIAYRALPSSWGAKSLPQGTMPSDTRWHRDNMYVKLSIPRSIVWQPLLLTFRGRVYTEPTSDCLLAAHIQQIIRQLSWRQLYTPLDRGLGESHNSCLILHSNVSERDSNLFMKSLHFFCCILPYFKNCNISFYSMPNWVTRAYVLDYIMY